MRMGMRVNMVNRDDDDAASKVLEQAIPPSANPGLSSSVIPKF
jgi:hypothetical protein